MLKKTQPPCQLNRSQDTTDALLVAMDYSLLSSMIFPTSIEFEDLFVDFPLKNHEKNLYSSVIFRPDFLFIMAPSKPSKRRPD
jgi:hypothetical protein